MRWTGRLRGQHGEAAAGQSEARPFFWLGGRRHLANAPYLLPSDEHEINRLDFQHYMLRFALKGNYAAPIGEPRDILDVACGTGRWALELAAHFPQANVIGLDIVPPPADAGMRADTRPLNYAFVPGDIMQGLPFPDRAFDFVHQRLVFWALPAASWPGVVRELARVTRPGGWVELVEGSGWCSPAEARRDPVELGPGLETMRRWIMEFSGRRGIDVTITGGLGEFLRGAGLESVESRQVVLPAGRWGGRVGAMLAANFVGLMEGVRGPILAMGITHAEAYDQTLAAARAELDDERWVYPFHIAYARRPQAS